MCSNERKLCNILQQIQNSVTKFDGLIWVENRYLIKQLKEKPTKRLKTQFQQLPYKVGKVSE